MFKLLIIFLTIIKIFNLSNGANDICLCDADDQIIPDSDTDEIKHLLKLLSARIEDIFAELIENRNRGKASKLVKNKDDFCGAPSRPSNCAEALAVTGTNKNGLYSIQSEIMVNSYPFFVYCDQNTDEGGWTVIQRRQDGSVDFYRPWMEYKLGFGNLDGEFWIGLDKIYALTTQSPQELLIVMEDFNGVKKFAKYSSFAIGSESEAYALNVLGKYSGDAGDSLAFQTSSKFSAKDVDNDAVSYSCAVEYRGAWWYKDCHKSNLNGQYLRGTFSEKIYARGVVWQSFRGYNYSLKFVQMMIRPQRG